MVIEDEDGEDSSLLHMYGASFTLPFAKQVCKTASKAVKEFSIVLSAEGKEILTNNVKEIAKSELSATDPNIGLETEEARKCIEETALKAQESTAAGRLTDVFSLDNPTGEVSVQFDPSQLKINEGPQHELLATSMMDETPALATSPRAMNSL